MINPCNQFCRDRHAGCQIDCEQHKAWADYVAKLRKDRQTKMMIDSYICEGIMKNRKRWARRQ